MSTSADRLQRIIEHTASPVLSAAPAPNDAFDATPGTAVLRLQRQIYVLTDAVRELLDQVEDLRRRLG